MDCQDKSYTVDVIIIGAGLSGLQVAHDIEKAGRTCMVLEAAGRVGGKILSHQCKSGCGILDVGATWINDISHPKVFALTQRYGLETVVQKRPGDKILQGLDGVCQRWTPGTLPQISMEYLQVVGLVNGMLEANAASLDLRNPDEKFDEITVEEFLQRNGATGDAYGLAATMVRALLGVEPSELSLSFYLDYIKSGISLKGLGSDSADGAQHLRIRQGMQTITEKIASGLSDGSIRLHSPVSSIEQRSTGCIVKTQAGSVFYCKKVVVSISTPLYSKISFIPPLSKGKLALAESNTLGYYSKMILAYTEPWWRDVGLSGSSISLIGPITLSEDTSVDQDNQYSITCFLLSDSGRAWSTLAELERRTAVLDHMANMAGPGNSSRVYEVLDIVEHEWTKDIWVQGGPTPVMKPGILSKYSHALRESHGHIHFVGTETAYEWKGYMEGAVSSGERGATEVLSELEKSDIRAIAITNA